MGAIREQIVQKWLDRSLARNIARHLKGTAMITQSNHVSPEKVKEYDAFDIQVFHSSAKEYLIEKRNFNEKEFKPMNLI